jgi:hypothetical protein
MREEIDKGAGNKQPPQQQIYKPIQNEMSNLQSTQALRENTGPTGRDNSAPDQQNTQSLGDIQREQNIDLQNQNRVN